MASDRNHGRTCVVVVESADTRDYSGLADLTLLTHEWAAKLGYDVSR
jgi:hypothetical protein